MREFTFSLVRVAIAAVVPIVSPCALAAEWSDTSLNMRNGSKFSEPHNASDGISKTILGVRHSSGYKYGTNFFSLDMLMSGRADPGNGDVGNPGAQEAYFVYRNMLDIGSVLGRDLKNDAIRGLGVTGGFDYNTKNDYYASKSRMLVVGPTILFDVPGFLSLSAYLVSESNAPNGMSSRYRYKAHAAVESAFDIPIGTLPLSVVGYAQWFDRKGRDEYGGQTAAETHVDISLMIDVGRIVKGSSHTFLAGIEYEFWRNKFGNPTSRTDPGATARTPMVRIEYHF